MSRIDSYIVFDFETGGFNASHSPATEIGLQIIHPDSLQEICRYGELIKSDIRMVSDKFKPSEPEIPKNPYKGGFYFEGAFKTTGLTIEHLNKNGKEYIEVANIMAEKFAQGKLSKGAWSKPILVGHNLSFDIPFLQVLFSLAKIDLSKLVQGSADYKGNWFPYYEDTMHISKKKWPKSESYKLGDCCKMAGIELVDAHRAVNDVVGGTTPLFVHFINSMRSNKVSQDQKETTKTRRTFQM